MTRNDFLTLFGVVLLAAALTLLSILSGVRLAEGALAAPAAEKKRYLPAYVAGGYVEPVHGILTTLDGRETITLSHLLHQWPDITVPVVELRLVNPGARQTNRGRLVGAIALRLGIQGIPNRRYYYKPRIACAAFVSYVMRRAGDRRPYSYAVNTFYPQIRRRGGVLVAARVSTRYTPYYRHLKPGDLIFFHRGRRFGHLEIFVGGGKTVGTSSSALRLGVRAIGNRGFRAMSVVRP